ncbi:MAG TPA: hypothetical protein VJT67_09335 [Longimicrobiaceae bacterium]|nr:hypothetical protein [Longimicrobiaceae bacterium]
MRNNDFDIRAVRETLGLTPEQLAAELYVTEGEVRAWESGALRLPGQMRRRMEYAVSRSEWDARMQASGLPACEWIDAVVLELAHASGSKQTALVKELTAHVAACGVCQAREAWARDNLPPPPNPPATGFARVFEAVRHLPASAQPAAYGAIALFLITGFRVLFFLPAITREPLQALQALGVALLAAGAGAVGGFGYTLTRPGLLHLGSPGDYLSGMVAVLCYMGALAAVSPLLGKPLISDVSGLVIFALVSVLFGLIVGKMIQETRGEMRTQP